MVTKSRAGGWMNSHYQRGQRERGKACEILEIAGVRLRSWPNGRSKSWWSMRTWSALIRAIIEQIPRRGIAGCGRAEIPSRDDVNMKTVARRCV